MYRRSFIGTGVCGALSTFSTMMVELLRMIDGAHWGLAAGYTAASLAAAFAAVFAATQARAAGEDRGVSVLLWLGVAALGGLASIARFLIDGVVSSSTRGRFPLGTLAVNLSGTVVLGVLVGRRAARRRATCSRARP